MSLSASAWASCLGVSSRSYAFDYDNIHRSSDGQKTIEHIAVCQLSELLDITTTWSIQQYRRLTSSIMLDCCLKVTDICILELMEPNFLAASASAVRSDGFDYNGTDSVSDS